jgi:peroxiredoxin Q/BCP
LLADENGELRKRFGVPSTFGLMPGRVTYIIDKQGVVREILNSQLFANKHVAGALAKVRGLAASS